MSRSGDVRPRARRRTAASVVITVTGAVISERTPRRTPIWLTAAARPTATTMTIENFVLIDVTRSSGGTSKSVRRRRLIRALDSGLDGVADRVHGADDLVAELAPDG